ncbi:hypothetical protein [Streptomyces sp. NBC_00199]|uniref:hypothetical protein n=1 Tax=Streptomyces sp. NBC_00199 TaxID=2975678 RepID=UPI002253C41E|nr:hypothetical protein [Streptomyces sp. NBC_00199]MCX5264668.1 hypothetical protein [Streptomyces sp. NBC_00199]
MGDLLSNGPDRPPWRPSRRLTAAAAAVASSAAVVVGIVALNGPDDQRPRAPESPSAAAPSGVAFPRGPDAPVKAGQTPGLVIAGMPLPRGATSIRRDRSAGAGPLTVVLRRSDGSGSLGRHGAVVTFPVAAPSGGRPIRVGGVSGRALVREVVWPVEGSYARVRGDLPQSELIAVAAATRVASGRPRVDAPRGLSVAATGTLWPAHLNETRYGSRATGEVDELSGGLTFTGVARGGGFEDALYATGAQPAGTVHGRPAVVTSAFGGNGALAWEPAPGVVVYVGYSGAALDRGAVDALRRLAARSRLLSPAQWQATGPSTSDRANDLGRAD